MQDEPIGEFQDQKLIKKIKNYVYDPNETIGSGFSSTVYKGLNELNNQVIAVKVIELSKIQNQVEKELLNNQVNALRCLNHKSILHTHEILMTKNNVYIMTEFCEIGDLQNYIRKNGKLNDFDALVLVKEIVEGYLVIEEKNIIHRDIKTANIFLTGSGCRIADFGFCEFIGERKSQISYNVGSPAYMSPEAYKENIYSGKSDIWSIGIILYEILLGETPDKNLTYTEMANNLMNGKISVGSEQIKQILCACFKKDLKERCSPSRLLELLSNEIQRLVSLNQMAEARMLQESKAIGAEQIFYRPKGLQNPQLPQNQRGIFLQSVPSGENRNLSSPSVHANQNKHNMISPPDMTRQRSAPKNYPIRPEAKPVKPNSYNYHISTLAFLWRLLKYVTESQLLTPLAVKTILYRHKNSIESSASLIKDSSQAYKQYQYFHSKFVEMYREKASNNSRTLNTARIDGLVNNPVGEDYAASSDIILTVLQECREYIISSNTPESMEVIKVSLLWDYLMVELEMLKLMSNGMSIETACEFVGLEARMKEKPKKKFGPSHLQLLKMKLREIQDYAAIFKEDPIISA